MQASPAPTAEAAAPAQTVVPTLDAPVNPVTGHPRHLACTGDDIADRIILVGDPGRAPQVAERFDEITFRAQHREIAIITGTYKGVPVTVMSTGMGTDNCEIVLNEIHVAKEYDRATNTWAKAPAPVRIIRVGTCGCPNPDVAVGTLAVTLHSIGMDNTCKYYQMPKGGHPESVERLAAAVNATDLGKVGVYTSMATPRVVEAIVKAHASNAGVKGRRAVAVGATSSGSGFYGCQGNAVGRLRGTLTVPKLKDILGGITLPIDDPVEQALVGGAEERVVSMEMESSTLCFLARMLRYEAGTVCAVDGKTVNGKFECGTPEGTASAIADAITVGLDAITSL